MEEPSGQPSRAGGGGTGCKEQGHRWHVTGPKILVCCRCMTSITREARQRRPVIPPHDKET